MILRIFIAVLLFELVSAPIICAVIDCGIRCWYRHRMKYLSDLLIFAGQQLSKTEGAKTNDQSGNV
jgi:hypothetical protein